MLLSNLSKGLAEIKSTRYGERVEITTERIGRRRSSQGGHARRRNSPNKVSDELVVNRNKDPLILPKTFTTRRGPLVLYTDSCQSRDSTSSKWSRHSTASHHAHDISSFNFDFVLQSGTPSRSNKTCVSERKLQVPSVASFAEAVLNFDDSKLRSNTKSKTAERRKSGKSWEEFWCIYG